MRDDGGVSARGPIWEIKAALVQIRGPAERGFVLARRAERCHRQSDSSVSFNTFDWEHTP